MAASFGWICAQQRIGYEREDRYAPSPSKPGSDCHRQQSSREESPEKDTSRTEHPFQPHAICSSTYVTDHDDCVRHCSHPEPSTSHHIVGQCTRQHRCTISDKISRSQAAASSARPITREHQEEEDVAQRLAPGARATELRGEPTDASEPNGKDRIRRSCQDRAVFP